MSNHEKVNKLLELYKNGNICQEQMIKKIEELMDLVEDVISNKELKFNICVCGDAIGYEVSAREYTNTIIVIPNEYKGMPVIRIADEAFAAFSELRTIILPISILEIGDYAFAGCTELKNITLHNSVLSIGNNAFEECYSLSFLSMPNGISTIEPMTFYSCRSLSQISMKNIECISINAFGRCTSLKYVMIFSKLKTLDYGAFNNCTNLESIHLPSSLKIISEETFYRCKSLKKILYTGTYFQWTKIKKEKNWNFDTPACILICSDERVYLESHEELEEDQTQSYTHNFWSYQPLKKTFYYEIQNLIMQIPQLKGQYIARNPSKDENFKDKRVAIRSVYGMRSEGIVKEQNGDSLSVEITRGEKEGEIVNYSLSYCIKNNLLLLLETF